MRWPVEDNPTPLSDGGPTSVMSADGALLPVRGLSAARLGADDVVPLWERLDGTRLIAGVAGPGPSSTEASDPIRATRRAGRVLESLRTRLENAAVTAMEGSQPGFVAITVDTDVRDPLTILGSEVQLAAAVLDRGDTSGGRVRLFWNGDSRVFFLDAVALCRLTFEDARNPGLPGPSAVWLRTVDVRPPTTGLIIACSHGAHGYFQSPWLLERALVASLERATSWRGFAEQVRFALERETKSGASFSAFPWGSSDFGALRQAILGPGGQRLSDLAARQASAGGAGWLNAWISLYGPIHERWRFALHAATRALESTLERSNAASAIAAPKPPPIDAPTPAVNAEVESDSLPEDEALPDYVQTVEAAATPVPGVAADRPPNWGGVADALNRLSAEWARAARTDRPEPKAEPKAKGAVVPLRVVSGGQRREEARTGLAMDSRRDGLGLALAANLFPEPSSADPAGALPSTSAYDPSPAILSVPAEAALAIAGSPAETLEQSDDAAFSALDAEMLPPEAFEFLDLVDSDGPPPLAGIPALTGSESAPSNAEEAAPATSGSPFTTSQQSTSALVNSPFSTSTSLVREADSSSSNIESTPPAAPPAEFVVLDGVDGAERTDDHFDDGDEDDLDAGLEVEPASLEFGRSADDSIAAMLESPIFEAEAAAQTTTESSHQTRRWPRVVAAVLGIAMVGSALALWPRSKLQRPSAPAMAIDSSDLAPVIEPVVTAQVPPRPEAPATRAGDRRLPEPTLASLGEEASAMTTPAEREQQEPLAATASRPNDDSTRRRSRYDIEPASRTLGLSALFGASPVIPAAAPVATPDPRPVAAAPTANAQPTEQVDTAPEPVPVSQTQQTLESLEVEARVHLVLRRGPSVKFPRSGLLVPGTRVQALARKEGTNWVRVLVRGRSMWANFHRDRLVPTMPGEIRQLAVIP